MDNKINESSLHPFVKWVGGKTKSLNDIFKIIPKEFSYYIEPFVGGGAVFLKILETKNIKKAIICDKNTNLMKFWKILKNGNLTKLLNEIQNIESSFNNLKSLKEKELFFYEIRDLYNKKAFIKDNYKHASYFIFLNKTSFNGIYRENSSGNYNVPFGKKNKIHLIEKNNLINIKKYMKKIIIITGDFSKAINYAKKHNFKFNETFIYLDPPYKTIKNNFTKYLKTDFTDNDQIRLAKTIKNLSNLNAKYLLSNSNDINYFNNLYDNSKISQINTRRFINCIGNKRIIEQELIITNI